MRLSWLIVAISLDVAASQLTVERTGRVINEILRAYFKMGFPYREDQFLDYFSTDDVYDFVIIGAGPGGCVTANRLTENPNWKVLLLEAGIEGNIYTDIPAMSPIFAFTNFNWKYVTEPQPELMCRGMANGR